MRFVKATPWRQVWKIRRENMRAVGWRRVCRYLCLREGSVRLVHPHRSSQILRIHQICRYVTVIWLIISLIKSRDAIQRRQFIRRFSINLGTEIVINFVSVFQAKIKSYCCGKCCECCKYWSSSLLSTRPLSSGNSGTSNGLCSSEEYSKGWYLDGLREIRDMLISAGVVGGVRGSWTTSER